MSSIAVSNKYIAVTRALYIDCFDFQKHDCINIPISGKPQENDFISDIAISSDCKYLAVVSAVSKQLIVFDLPLSDSYKCFTLPRSASKIRFTTSNEQLLVADKTGDVLIYNINATDSGTKLLGHLSLLLDVLQTDDGKYIITSDRDEKIKVSCYPNTYSIQTYCLGHKEFVKHIEILPHDKNYLTSASGDGTIKVWDYLNGRLVQNINVNDDIKDSQLREKFIKLMNDDGIEVDALPIVYFTISRLDDFSSLVIVAVHTCHSLLVYKLQSSNKQFNHELLETIAMETFPSAIKLHNLSLYIFDEAENIIKTYKIENKDKKINIQSDEIIKVFEKDAITIDSKDNQESIKVLYKRKFDNVQEYQERKKQRLEKSIS